MLRALCFALCLVPTVAAADGWKLHKTYDDGVVLETRKIPGQRFDELRVGKHVDLTPKQMADAVWRIRKDGWEFRVHKKRLIMKETESERLMYSQLLTPVISDRDYTIRQTRHFDPTSGVHQMLFEAANNLGPPPNDDHVRVEIIRGGWTLEPDGDGTYVTYFVLNDPAGSLPPWIARGELRDTAVLVFRELVASASPRPIAGAR